FFSSRRRHTRSKRDWSSDVCSSDLTREIENILSDLNAKKVYLLCDPILKEINAIEKVTDILEGENIEYVISTNVMAEPSVEKGRSEERRVGKECRYRRWRSQLRRYD